MDDSLGELVPRLMGSRAGVASNRFKAAGVSLLEPAFAPTFEEQEAWLRRIIEAERLVLYDMTDVPKDLTALNAVIKDLRASQPDRPLIIIGDNFHHFDIASEARAQGEERQRMISRYAKEIAVTHHATMIMTMEVPKEEMRDGIRPRLRSLKGSTAMVY